MINAKIFQIYDNFSSVNIQEFETFVNSGFKGYKRDYSSIMDCLKFLKKKKFLDYSDDDSLEYLCGKTKLKRAVLLNRLSELHKLSEYYSIVDSIDKSVIQKDILLLDSYLNKNNYRLFDYKFNSSLKYLREHLMEHDSLRYYRDLYMKGSMKAFQTGNTEKYFQYDKLRNDYSVAYFIGEILSNSAEFYQRKLSGNYVQSGMEKILQEIDITSVIFPIKKYDMKSYGFLETLHMIHLMYNDFDNTGKFQIARKTHKKYFKLFTASLNKFIYFTLINYCIHQSNSGKAEFYNDLFEIINEKLKEGIFEELRENNIPVNHFRDYVFIALRLNQIQWVKDFVDKYSVYLPEEYKQDEINITHGLVLIEEAKYSEALNLFAKVTKLNYIHYSDSSLSKARCNYKLGFFEEGLDELTRLKNYLKYHTEIPVVFKVNTEKYINDMIHLIKYSSSGITKDNAEFHFRNQLPRRPKKWVVEELNNLGIVI